jgi:hypothetical protein
MINNCQCCGKFPKELGMISCENDLCLEFGVEYFVYDWQALRVDKDIDSLAKLQEIDIVN